ncbi:MAG: YdcF family protein [Lachnospiraceae bacterium]|nr:YdcF family protein [Lachnospiraceae bacterium]
MFSAAFGILGILSLVYFGIIVVYSGIETSMAWFWPALGILCFLLARGDAYYHHHRKQVPLWIPVSIATLCITAVVIFLILQVLIFGGMIRSAPDHLDYLIVLGTKVRDDDISSSLKRRLDKVIRYAEEHPDTKLVLSGGQGEDEPVTEAFAMAEYLRYNGIAPEQMLLETNSTSTKENMICSKALIDDQRQKEKARLQEIQKKKQVQKMELERFVRRLETGAGAGDRQGAEESAVSRGNTDGADPWDAAAEDQRISLDFRGPCAARKSLLPALRQKPEMPAAELTPDKPLQIGVLTSNFHLYRAMKIGERYGFDRLYGVSSSSDPVLFIHLCVRESIAILKDKFMGNM